MSRRGVVAHPIRYTRVDGINIAYQIVGDGPVDLVLVDEWSTPLEGRWDVPAIAGRLERLCSFARLISFDKRGIGLSEPWSDTELASPELWVRDLVAVLDAAGAERPVVLGAHEGGPIALLYAASVPARTEALVLVNTGPRFVRAEGFPYGFAPEEWRPDLEGIVELWENGGGGEEHIAATRFDPWWRDWYARVRRAQVAPAGGLALLRMIGQLDVRHVLPAVQAPTLVLHRRGNGWWSVDGARWMAESMPRATFVELDGADNLWWSGDADRVVDEIEQFVLGERTSQPSQRQLVTVVFTDVVDSTGHAVRVGDDRWRQLLDGHDAVTVAEARRHGGTVVKQLGDGFLLRFDGPAAAIRAAVDIRRELGPLGLTSRLAVHTGEAVVRGEDLSGVAVHIAARVLALARPGEILATGVVRGLVAGSTIAFADRGRHRLKGIPDEWDVYAVIGETTLDQRPVAHRPGPY
jgi:class 3 adenylate cyclase